MIGSTRLALMEPADISHKRSGSKDMLFVIHAIDRREALSKRLENYAAHRAFLADTGIFGVKIVISGPLTADDGETMIGSLFIVEAESRQAVERFNENDPFRHADIWERVTITGFIKRQDNRLAV